MAHIKTLDLAATHRLGPRAFLLFWTRHSKWALIALLVTAAAWLDRAAFPVSPVRRSLLDLVLEIAFFLALAVFLMMTARAWFEYRSYAYRFEREFFQLTRGYITRQEIGVVYHQIQTVTLQHGLFDRAAGVTHLVIVMTGNQSQPSQVILPALDHHKARLVQQELLRQARIRSPQFAASAPHMDEAEMWR